MVGVVADHEPALPRPWKPLSEVDARSCPDRVWYWGPAGYALHLRRDARLELVSLTGPGRAARFHRTGTDTWIGADGYWDGETLRPVYAGDRLDHLDIGGFVFTREPYDAAADIPGGVDADGWRAVPD